MQAFSLDRPMLCRGGNVIPPSCVEELRCAVHLAMQRFTRNRQVHARDIECTASPRFRRSSLVEFLPLTSLNVYSYPVTLQSLSDPATFSTSSNVFRRRAR